MGLRSKTLDILDRSVRDMSDFSRGNLTGKTWKGGWSTVPLGRLPADWHHGAPYERPVYVIRSYRTPIAWRWDDGFGGWHWVIPNVKYSLTTTIHQSAVRSAIRRAYPDDRT